jgi:hypothetical protein
MLAAAGPQPDRAAEFDFAAHHPLHSLAHLAAAAPQPTDPRRRPPAWSQAEPRCAATMPVESVPKVVRVVTWVGFGPRQLTNRLTRPIANISRKAAVSPKPSSMHNRPQRPHMLRTCSALVLFFQAKAAHAVSIWRQLRFAASQVRTDCLSAQPEPRPKSMSDSLLHDLCCDCPISPTPIGPQATQNCVPSRGDLRLMVPRNVS